MKKISKKIERINDQIKMRTDKYNSTLEEAKKLKSSTKNMEEKLKSAKAA